MSSLTSLQSHKSLTRAMYRALLRGLNGLKSKIPKVDQADQSIHLRAELRKVSTSPELYGKFLTSELKYYVDGEFRKEYSHLNEKSLHLKLVDGVNLIQALNATKQDPDNSKNWTGIISILVNHRNNQFLRQQWKAHYLKNRQEIDAARNRDKPSLVKKRLQSRAQSRVNLAPMFSLLTANEQYKVYKNQAAESKHNAAFVVRNYLKKLQLQGRIPNPYKLPYVSDSLSKQTLNMPDPTVLLPGSTKHSVMKSAYDFDYIESILKPEIEFKINKHHHLDKLNKQVKEDGPFKVKIRSTNSGAMTAHFLELPYTRKQMKDIAMDVKRLVRTARKSYVWNYNARNLETKMSETKVGDGYAVRDSKGYSHDEIMFTREYHEKLVDSEALWELLLEEEIIRGEGRWTPETAGELTRLRRSLRASWREALEISTQAIENEVHLFYEKYKVDKDHAIFKDQAKFQKEMNAVHQKRTDDYKELLATLKLHQVFVHSDLVNFNHPVTRGYDEELKSEERKKEKLRHGVPETERTAMGKRLGDYLQDIGYHAYKMGYLFAKRFKF